MGTLQSVPVPRGQYLATYSQVLSYQTLRCPIAKACRPPSTGCNPWPRIKNCPRLATPWAVLNCQRTTPPLPYSTNEKHTRAKKISPVRKFSLFAAMGISRNYQRVLSQQFGNCGQLTISSAQMRSVRAGRWLRWGPHPPRAPKDRRR